MHTSHQSSLAICILSLFSLLLFSSVQLAHATKGAIHYMAEENPPYSFLRDGKVQGIAAELLVAMSAKTSHPLELEAIEMLPWARAYKTVQTSPGTCLFSMGRIKQREKQFKWVGPIIELTIGLVAKKERQIIINSVEELSAYRIGTIRDGAPEQLLLAAGFPDHMLERVTKPDQNILKLIRNRIDMLAFNTDSTKYTMRAMGLSPGDYETVFTLKKVQLYYAFHKDTDESIIRALNLALHQLKEVDASGHSPYESILRRYLGQ